MIIFHYGDDGYRMRQARQELVRRYQSKYSSGMNLSSLDLGIDGSLDHLREALRSQSFFHEVRFIIAAQPFWNAATAQGLYALISVKDLDKTKEIVFLAVQEGPQSEWAPKHKQLFALLKRSKQSQQFEALRGVELSSWIRRQAAQLDQTLDPKAIQLLIERVGSKSWTLAQELEKLANYCQGRIIRPADVRLLTTAQGELNIFDLVDAIAQRDAGKATVLLYQHLEQGQDPYYILTMFLYQARNLVMVHDLVSRQTSTDSIARIAGIHPFVARKTIAQARRFSTAEAHTLFERLALLERQVKTGERDLTDELYALSASSNTPPQASAV